MPGASARCFTERGLGENERSDGRARVCARARAETISDACMHILYACMYTSARVCARVCAEMNVRVYVCRMRARTRTCIHACRQAHNARALVCARRDERAPSTSSVSPNPLSVKRFSLALGK